MLSSCQVQMGCWLPFSCSGSSRSVLGILSATSSNFSRPRTRYSSTPTTLWTVIWPGLLDSHTGEYQPLVCWGARSDQTYLSRYAWTTVFATEFLQAATIVAYWGPSPNFISTMFYIITPLVFVVLNCLNVKVLSTHRLTGGRPPADYSTVFWLG